MTSSPDPAAGSGAPRTAGSAPFPAPLRRPDPEVALEYATRIFVSGERLDMQTLAAALGVGRTTLYRWIGGREEVLGDVLASLSREVWAGCQAHATGEGVERALDTFRRFMDHTSQFPALRDFARREPGLALKLLMQPDGPVAESLRDGVAAALRETLPDQHDRISDEIVDILVQVGTALEWAPVIIGDPPPLDRAMRLVRALLEVTLRDSAG